MKAAGLHRICVQAFERKRVKNIADAIFFIPDVFAAGRLQTSCDRS
jgi:hypothetical protein